MDSAKKDNAFYSNTDSSKVELKDEEWKNILSPEVFYVARQKGTERPWTSKFEKFEDIGTVMKKISLSVNRANCL